MPQDDQEDQNKLPEDELIINPTAAQMEAQTQAGQQQYLGSLKKQADVSKGAVGEIEKTGQAALAGEREKSGRAFAAQVAQGGGGSLAGMRQSQLSRGIAEGQLMGEYGMQKIAAQRLAAQAQSEYLAEKQKLQKAAYEGQGMAQKETTQAVDDVKNAFTTLKNSVTFLTQNDRAGLAHDLAQKYLTKENRTRNPMLYNRIKQEIDDMQFARGNYGSALDMATKLSDYKG